MVYQLVDDEWKGKPYFNKYGFHIYSKEKYDFNSLKSEYNSLMEIGGFFGLSLVGFDIDLQMGLFNINNEKKTSITKKDTIKNILSDYLILKSNIVDDKTNPIPYCEIYIPDSNFYTISNKRGEFDFKIPKSYSNEKVIIEAFGYQSKEITINSLMEQQIILQKNEFNTESLAPLVLNSKRVKLKEKGVSPRKNVGGYIQGKTSIGAEIGRYFDNMKPIKIYSVYVYIGRNNEDSFKLRAKIYNAHNGDITNVLYQEVFESSIETGWIEIKLDEPIVLSNDFLVSFQWLDSETMNPTIGLGLALFPDKYSYFRKSLISQWENVNSKQYKWGIKFKYKNIKK